MSLYDISWKVSEEEYRADNALSYSTLATYKRGGFQCLPHLFDKKDSPALTFGSAVDAILTGGRKEFNERFVVCEFPQISDSLKEVASCLFSRYKDQYKQFKSIPEDILADVGEECNYYRDNKYRNVRIKKIKEECPPYYELLVKNEGKTVLDNATYEEVLKAVTSLRSDPATKDYFIGTPFDKVERFFQLKFKAKLQGVEYRCMADLLVVDNEKKVIYPIDLKTTGKAEYDFYKSFIDWDYQLQARLYWRIIRDNLDRSVEFKDYELKDFTFVVVSKMTYNPLRWTYKDTKKEGTLHYGKNGQIECLDPFTIGKELSTYLKSKRTLPIGVEKLKNNDIVEHLMEIE